MDWKTFIASIVDSLAWPVVAVIVVLILKDAIKELLPRLRRFKHRDTEFEFAEKISEMVRESETEAEEEFDQDISEPESENQFNSLLKLAEVSPRAAVVEAYRILEHAADSAIKAAYPDLDSYELRHPVRARRYLVKANILSPDQYDQLRELRNLRNLAAHSREFKLTDTPIEAYIDISLSLARKLDRMRHNNEINEGQG